MCFSTNCTRFIEYGECCNFSWYKKKADKFYRLQSLRKLFAEFRCRESKMICRLRSLTDFLTYLLMELSASREAANCGATQETSQHFMEPEGSLPPSQEPSTGPYPKPDNQLRLKAQMS
jgi:hypothetical protein